MVCVLLLTLILSLITCRAQDYWSERAKLIEKELSLGIGASIKLTEKEKLVNSILMKLKLSEMESGLKHPKQFPAAMHFFRAKPYIEKSPVFKIIKMLPKGALLHTHHSAATSNEYLYNLTYADNLYGCVKDERLFLDFSVSSSDTECSWALMKNLRDANSSFDSFVKSQISMVTDNPQAHPDMWKRFVDALAVVQPMIKYWEIAQRHFYQIMKELHEDNVFYFEMRIGWHSHNDFSGNTHTGVEVIEAYIDIMKTFKEDHPDFLGGKLILGTSRNNSAENIAEFTRIVLQAKEKFPNFIAGLDLYGEEDKGQPLKAFIPELLEARKKIKLFLHAGETNWNGMLTDSNVIDAVLLNVSRIGHGYAIVKHKEVLRLARQNDIAIEVCPISNQVLGYVSDLRNHPAEILMNLGFKVVICNDDPGVWGVTGLSYDWYMAFMGMASRQSDLAFLKQLALNSIEYSAMDELEKQSALEKWVVKWDEFLNRVISTKNWMNL